MQIMKVGNWYFVADKFGVPLDKEVFQHEHQAYEHLGRLLPMKKPKGGLLGQRRTIMGLHIVPLSGGKDSTALALWLAEINPGTNYTYLFTPTGDELPEMNEHLDRFIKGLGDEL